jgi:hypothetical protein
MLGSPVISCDLEIAITGLFDGIAVLALYTIRTDLGLANFLLCVK